MPDHLCPYGLKSMDLLERQELTVEDHDLETHDQNALSKNDYGVDTTRQTSSAASRSAAMTISQAAGHRDLFGRLRPRDQLTRLRTVLSIRAFKWFIAISMCLLSVQKLQDIASCSTMFLSYDLLARRWVRYGYVYPFGPFAARHLHDCRRPDLGLSTGGCSSSAVLPRSQYTRRPKFYG